MPNWCLNNLEVRSDDLTLINKFKLALNSEGLFHSLKPNPSGDWDYGWSVENWGTKWDVTDVYIGNDAEDDEIDFSFSTAWAPPVEAFRYWAEQDGRINYRLYYFEEGVGFVGEAQYEAEGF